MKKIVTQSPETVTVNDAVGAFRSADRRVIGYTNTCSGSVNLLTRMNDLNAAPGGSVYGFVCFEALDFPPAFVAATPRLSIEKAAAAGCAVYVYDSVQELLSDSGVQEGGR